LKCCFRGNRKKIKKKNGGEKEEKRSEATCNVEKGKLRGSADPKLEQNQKGKKQNIYNE